MHHETSSSVVASSKRATPANATVTYLRWRAAHTIINLMYLFKGFSLTSGNSPARAAVYQPEQGFHCSVHLGLYLRTCPRAVAFLLQRHTLRDVLSISRRRGYSRVTIFRSRNPKLTWGAFFKLWDEIKGRCWLLLWRCHYDVVRAARMSGIQRNPGKALKQLVWAPRSPKTSGASAREPETQRKTGDVSSAPHASLGCCCVLLPPGSRREANSAESFHPVFIHCALSLFLSSWSWQTIKAFCAVLFCEVKVNGGWMWELSTQISLLWLIIVSRKVGINNTFQFPRCSLIV